MESVWRQTGVKPKELDDLIELPNSMLELWIVFLNLNSARSSNGFGINPISYVEIKSYYDLIGVQPEEWELLALRKLDTVVLEIYAEQSKKEQQRKSKA